MSVAATCVPQGRATLDWPHPFRTGVSKGCTMQALGLNGVGGLPRWLLEGKDASAASEAREAQPCASSF